MRPVRILAISGSLRAASSNSALVRAAAVLAPDTVSVVTFEALADIPPFNPDLDVDPAPAPVAAFRTALAESDAVLISTPEYAHGVPGVLKNALDWIVGSGELIDKPVAVVNASPRATHAYASLVETLTVMSARVVRDASLTVPLSGRALDADAIRADAALSSALREAIHALAQAT
jgi:NAD(P)H-dependent FMN reductase